MVWLIVVVAMVVMGLAAIAGTGRWGQMPPPVTDRPKPYFPDLPFGEQYLAQLRLPVVLNGYATDQVDGALVASISGEMSPEMLARARFDVVRRGYAMDAVDELIERVVRQASRSVEGEEATPPLAELSPESLNVRDNREVRTTEEIEDAHGSDEAPHW